LFPQDIEGKGSQRTPLKTWLLAQLVHYGIDPEGSATPEAALKELWNAPKEKLLRLLSSRFKDAPIEVRLYLDCAESLGTDYRE
jgi:hypothetical protein